jgi:hypothetical protein
MAVNLNNRWVDLAMRLILGVTFVGASFHKIADPAAFAKIIYGYSLFPHLSINIIAIIIPFVEMATGLLLIFNVYSKAAVTLIGAMLAGFIIAISINLARGHEFDCGCFSFDSGKLMSGSTSLLIRDIFLLALCIFLFRFRSNTSVKRTVNG